MAKSVLKQLKENEREVRRKLIIDAAKRLFKDKSFHEIGMRDIASEAGISVASLYQYFPCQDDLFVEILTADIQFIKSILWNEQTELEEIAVQIVIFLIENEDIFQMMSHFMLRGEKNPNTLNKFNIIHVLFLDMLDKALEKSADSENISLYSHAFFASLFGNVITFRNFPAKDRAAHKDNILHIARTTALAFKEAILSECEAN